jgi:hypothetical protein
MKNLNREDIEALASVVVFVLIPLYMLFDLFFGNGHRDITKEGD